MSGIPSSAGRFRHVVFPGFLRIGGPAVNYQPIARHVPSEQNSLSEDEDAWIRQVCRLAGLDPQHYRAQTLKRRLAACWRALRVNTAAQARLLLQREPAAIHAALDTLFIGVTRFFRDPAAFESLGNLALPEIIAERRPLRVWSAGCSNGAELFSVAMLLAERGVLQRCHLIGTDCRHQAVRRARAGCFELPAIDDVPSSLRERYIQVENGRFRMEPALQAATKWRTGDAIRAAEPGPWDLILCRNLAIYLNPGSASALWKRLAAVLRPGGYLVLGKAERPTGVPNLAQVAPMIYRWEGN